MDIDIKSAIGRRIDDINRQVRARAAEASTELRNCALEVLGGERSGKVYKKPGTYGKQMNKQTKGLIKEYGHKLRGGQLYRASAPGEPPANRSDVLRTHWKEEITTERQSKDTEVKAFISTEVKYAEPLQEGSDNIKPRPFREPIIEMAKPRVKQIFNGPYY